VKKIVSSLVSREAPTEAPHLVVNAVLLIFTRDNDEREREPKKPFLGSRLCSVFRDNLFLFLWRS
jgi:hypothetical protein